MQLNELYKILLDKSPFISSDTTDVEVLIVEKSTGKIIISELSAPTVKLLNKIFKE